MPNFVRIIWIIDKLLDKEGKRPIEAFPYYIWIKAKVRTIDLG